MRLDVGFEDEAIIREANVGGKAGISFFVSEIVADVSEPGVAGFEFLDEGEGLSDARVHGMRGVAEGVEDEVVEIVEEGFGGVREGAEVGEIGEAAEAEAEDGSRAVVGGDGDDLVPEELEGAIKGIDGMEFDLGREDTEGVSSKM